MDEVSILTGIEDVTTELEVVSKSINDSNEVSIAIKDILQTYFEQLIDKKNYDENIGQIIINAASDIVSKITSMKIDMTPIMRIAGDISKHNQMVISAIADMKKSEGENNYSELFLMIVKMIESNNEFIKVSMDQKEYLVKMDELITSAGKRPSYIFKHELWPNGTIKETIAVPKI